MKHQLKLVTGIVGAAIIVLTTVFSASATPNLARGEAVVLAAPAEADTLAAASCTSMKATSDVAWVTLTEDGDIDEQVDVYPPDTNLITPLFEFNCVPKKATLVTIFTLDGEQVYSDKESLKASNAKGVYAYPLGTDDESPLPEGTWGVEFYNNKTQLVSSEIVVGEEQETSDLVTVQGTVTDKKSKKAIKNALVVILTPGVTVQDFIDGGQKEEDVYTIGQTNTKGKFVLEDQLEREVEYSIIVVAKGYKATAADGWSIGPDDPNPLDITITMNK